MFSPDTAERRSPMARRNTPKITQDTRIGSDVDLDAEDVRLKSGQKLTREVADRVSEEGKRPGGRPSLSGNATISPQIAFRVPAEIRELAEAVAASEHKTVSQLAREALEDRLKERRAV